MAMIIWFICFQFSTHDLIAHVAGATVFIYAWFRNLCWGVIAMLAPSDCRDGDALYPKSIDANLSKQLCLFVFSRNGHTLIRIRTAPRVVLYAKRQFAYFYTLDVQSFVTKFGYDRNRWITIMHKTNKLTKVFVLIWRVRSSLFPFVWFASVSPSLSVSLSLVFRTCKHFCFLVFRF